MALAGELPRRWQHYSGIAFARPRVGRGSLSMARPAYVLGHSAFELERLARQERLIGGITRDYFRAAGLPPGMRVLDVGRGTGGVAFHAAQLVGPSGPGTGTDLAPAAGAAPNGAAAG